MGRRILAIILLVTGLVFVLYGARGVIQADRMGAFLGLVAKSHGETIDPDDWARHWDHNPKLDG